MTPPVVEALVQTGAVETPYWRAGQGRCVLLLVERGASPPPLFLGLAASFRVTAPAPPAAFAEWVAPEGAQGEGDAATLWLRGVIDGLGLDRPGLVADHRFGAFVLRFEASDPDRVGRVVVIPGAASELGELVRWIVSELQDD